MNFDESVNYLYGLGNEVLAMKLGLENIGKLLGALGDPQNKYLKIQIAGTNGKGSTCAFLESICLSAGINVGMTTSPHLISVTERVRVSGIEISEEDFARHSTFIRKVSENLVESRELETVPTYFEQVTAIALNYFAEQNVELAILETGLGGRFDATTAAKAEIVAITPIGLDHQRILGATLPEIASEKAAIIRPGVKAFLSHQEMQAERVIVDRCREAGVEPHFTDVKFEIAAVETAERSKFDKKIDLTVDSRKYRDIQFKMPGEHQIQNAALAVAISGALPEFGFTISSANVLEGLSNAVHKGRLQYIDEFLLDGAHNVAGALALRKYLDQTYSEPVVMIYGSTRDKDISEIAEILFPKAGTIVLTKANNPRAMEIEELEKFVPRYQNVEISGSVADALTIAKERAGDGCVLVTGSLYLVGEALAEIQKRHVL
ncbi:MAG: bifunctional folylpolyglutamate synthase/dihydrofolate synthase [Pyrinomonadaceae bacterium]|nr:bifunctional folylpolyglutamate synthase/dihydrofolate synthase [Pyrinomonadaceae bacterium]